MRDLILLDNQKTNVFLGEDALDFNFNDSDNEDSSVSLLQVTAKQNSFVSSSSREPSISHAQSSLKRHSALQINEGTTSQGVPFEHTLSNHLRHQDLFIIEGAIIKYGLRFTINLIYGVKDIAFHLNPRLDQNYIARNSYINEEWGEEEGFALMKSPLQDGKNFQIQIFVARESYLVCVNGYHMFAYNHRVQPQSVEKIEIFGDIELKTALLLSSDVYPNRSLMKYKTTYDSPHVPFTHLLEHGLTCGNKITISGKIKLLPVSFRINLQSAEEVFPHPLIAYHLNVRYEPDGYIVQNTWGYACDKWDEELRSPLPLALSPGKDFELNIFLYDSYIVTKGDSWSLPVFKQRLIIDNVSCIYIQGDIKLNSFRISPFRSKEDPTDLFLI